jgi:hypothetical protein
MFCPRCGEERVSTETSFCSRCGFLLAGTLELLMTGGVNPSLPPVIHDKRSSPRNRGVKQGLFILLLTFLIVPLVAILSAALDIEPWAVAISAILLFVGGSLRMAYAWMFESGFSSSTVEGPYSTGSPSFLNRQPNVPALPPQHDFPVSSYIAPATGNWRDTSDLEPKTVTEGTTKLLEKEERHQ